MKTGQLPAFCVLAGHFDGVHVGHRAALALLRQEAAAAGLPSAVLHLAGEHAGEQVLSTAPETEGLVHTVAAPDAYLEAPDGAFALTERLIGGVLAGELGAKVLVAGEGSADVPLLASCAGRYGYRLALCPRVCVDGAVVTSARAAALLLAGDVEAANRLLGHPYLIMGPVVHGQGRGRAAGMPTANIGYSPDKLLPREGVYATRADIAGRRYYGLASVGRRPSVDDDQRVTVENYMPDFAGNLYGETLALEVLFRVRDMLKLSGIAAVKAQVDKDWVAAKARLEEG